MRMRELMFLNNIPHPYNRIRTQRNHIRDTPHESVGIHSLGSRILTSTRPFTPIPLSGWRRHNRVSNQQPPIRQTHQTSWEMTTRLQDQNAGLLAADLDLFFRAFDESACFAHAVEAVEPAFVFPGEVDGAFEGVGPFEVRGVVVGMGDYDGGEAALVVDPVDGWGVEEGYAVPEDVALWSFDEDGSLPDGELRLGIDHPKTVFVFVEFLPFVFVGAFPQLGHSRERLACWRNELARVITDSTTSQQSA